MSGLQFDMARIQLFQSTMQQAEFYVFKPQIIVYF